MDDPRPAPRSGATLAIIGLTLVYGMAALPLGHVLSPEDALGPRTGRELIWWAIGGFVLAWVVFAERQPLGSIGLKWPGWRSWAWGLAAALLMIASIMLSYAVIFPVLGLKMNMKAVAAITHVPLWLQTATMLRAGVVEEIVFRGYAIERIQMLTGSKWVAACVSAAVFIAVHISSWGYAQLIVVGFGAAILTGLYVARRDLASNMFAHFLADFVGFMLARLQGA